SPGISLNVHAGGPVSVNAPITTSNGDFTVQGFNGATSAGSFANTAAINVGTANININTSGPISLGSDLKTTGSSFTTSGNPGAWTVTLVSGGAINQTGGLITADVLTGNSVGG